VKVDRLIRTKLLPFLARTAKSILKNRLLQLMLALFVLGFVAGKQAHTDPTGMPFEEMFENLSVLSYRDTPTDTNPHFIVELSTRGKVFRQYDVDTRQFLPPESGRSYRRSISGTRYQALTVRGHVDRGFWLEISKPTQSMPTLLPEQFDELYRTSIDFVKPVSAVASVLGTLSGYSVGYRAAVWSRSLSNPAVQKRVLATQGVGRMIAREAWRRVLLEPVIMAHENDPDRFAETRGVQRIYTNFFRLALNDSNSFIPFEAARLDSAGHPREARLMTAFAQAVTRAAQDTCHLNSEDFQAIENWASLLDQRGHWAVGSPGAIPPSGSDRFRYFGTLAYYGIAPSADNESRIWVGPRVLIREGELEGYVSDDIPRIAVGCPLTWHDWLKHDTTGLSGQEWTAQWMRESRELAQFVDFGRDVLSRLHPQ
jgi:hypothetical protein